MTGWTYLCKPWKVPLTDILPSNSIFHPGYEVAETTDENPERVAILQRLTTAYLRSALKVDESAWERAVSTIEASTGDASTGDAVGIERKAA